MSECIASGMMLELAAKVVILTDENEMLKASNHALMLQLAQARSEEELHVYTCVYKHELRRLWPRENKLTKELLVLMEEVKQKTISADELKAQNDELKVLIDAQNEYVTELKSSVNKLNGRLLKYQSMEDRVVEMEAYAYKWFQAEQENPAKRRRLLSLFEPFDETQMDASDDLVILDESDRKLNDVSNNSDNSDNSV